MKIAIIISAIAILLSFAAWAAESQASFDFSALKALAAPRPPSTGPLTEAQADAERRQQITQFVLAAEKAKVFYERYATLPEAAVARKIEVESLLRATRDGATENEGKALRLARDFRSDKTNSSRVRYEIAAAVRDLDVHTQNLGQSKAEILAAYEKSAMDLYGEFPNEPAVFDLFLGVARNADAAKARSLANQVLLMPAPAGIKEAARVIIATLDMPGKPLEAEWSDDRGAFHKLSDYRGKIVVFYLWATWTMSVDADQKIKTQLPPSAILVSVNLDQDSALGKAAKSKSAIGGIAYYDNRGLNAPLALQLRATRVPSVCVVNANGIYIGGGSPDELASLLAAAGKP